MSYNDQDRTVFHPRPSTRTARPTSPSPTISLSTEHITEALQKSPDNGATLDLAHRHIAEITEPIAESLARNIETRSAPLARIALGHNRLTSLPVAFSQLSRLRYLNLKSNNFTTFPEVLTMMSSLEVLDLSRNKIRRLPMQAGSLTNIRVFSLSKNKLSKLPVYMVEFQKLRIFKIDQNPVEWPPKYITEPDGDLNDSKFMEEWISALQTWIQDNSQPSRKSSGDSIASERKLQPSLKMRRVDSYLPIDEQLLSISSVAHSRTGSNESDNSTYSAIEASLRFSDMSGITTRSSKPERPPRLNLSPFSGYNSGISPPRSPSSSSPISYLPTPDDSVSSAEEDTAKGLPADPSSSQYQQQQLHLRNASYAGADQTRPPLSSKKSLPDLRLAKSRPQSRNPSPVDLPSASPLRQDSGFSEEPSSSRSATVSSVTPMASPTVMDRPSPAPPIDVERNSYFRRLSTLPISTISKAIPQSLLTLVDAARGILFAVSQVYQTLQHYTVYAIDERLSAVLLKVLDPASNYMLQLINALDRFDATSRRTLPSPTVCRAVVESCRDTVAVFGKAMGVLALQLKVLATRDDVRYTRQMLLVLYGATAEISNSWQTIMPHIAEVEPLLRERPPPASHKHQHQAATSLRARVSPPTPVAAPSIPSSTAPRPLWRSHSAQPPVENERTRMMRRHAGSFSSKDVQIGKLLPSYVDPPSPGESLPTASMRVTTPRLTLRQASSQPNSASPAVSAASTFRRSWGNHSRQGSQSSLLASSATSSASSSPSAPTRPPLQEVNSSNLLDNDAIDAMQLAVDVAPFVWEMMDTIMDDIHDSNIDLPHSLKNAKALTKRLGSNIRAVKEADPAADRKALRNDATVFAKTVISLCNVFKIHGATHPLPPVLRANMIALMNATEDSVMLLHVSSFSPSNAARPYSPIVTGFNSPFLGVENSRPDDGRLGANLTRSRSALHSNVVRMTSPVSREIPRTALPSQGFKVPIPSRRGTREDGHEFHL